MTSYNPWEIILVPFLDGNAVKKRPAVILSSRDYHDKTSNIIAAIITTASNTNWPSDVPIIHLETTGLNGPSVIRPKLFTTEIIQIRQKVGHLHPKDQSALSKMLRPVLAPFSPPAGPRAPATIQGRPGSPRSSQGATPTATSPNRTKNRRSRAPQGPQPPGPSGSNRP